MTEIEITWPQKLNSSDNIIGDEVTSLTDGRTASF